MQWSVTGQTAQLDWSGWKWRLDMAQPSAGALVLGQLETPWHLLAIDPVPGHVCQIDDWFVRGSDLMVRYAQSASDSFAFQVDYRAIPASELGTAECGFDLWLSVQTQLLDSHPTLEVINRVAAGEWRASGESGLVIEEGPVAMLTCQTQSGYVAIFVHPSDQEQSELLADAGQARLRLFGNFMEKGVIRRGRLRCLVSSQQVASNVLQQAYNDFAHSALPLTT